MSRDKQTYLKIKPFADDLRKAESWCNLDGVLNRSKTAQNLYNMGYRKSSEVAREIITDIDDALHKMATEYANAGHPEYFAVCEMVHHKVIRPFEKKYTEGGE